MSILVIAGNYQQAQYWMRMYGFVPREWHYVREERDMLGYEDPLVWCVGTYWTSPMNQLRFEEYLRIRGATFIYPGEVDPAAQPFVDV